jgi:hypothetical protein
MNFFYVSFLFIKVAALTKKSLGRKQLFDIVIKPDPVGQS